MDIVLLLLAIPLVWAFAARYLLPATIETGEAAVNSGIAAFVMVALYCMFFWSNTRDTEILNGYVTGKERNKVSCEHSYQCMCVQSCSSDGRGGQSCTEICQTCYDHSYDIDWDVYTTVGNLEINRIDRQGLGEPPRWTAVRINEPAATSHGYTNYVMASPASLFSSMLTEEELEAKKSILPQPHGIYDYYRVRHTFDIGAHVASREAWEHGLAHTLRDLGKEKQVNITMVFIAGHGREYKQLLERAWLGGKKNEIVIIVGVTGKQVVWVESFTFGKSAGNGMLHVLLRDELQKLKSVDDAMAGVAVITGIVRKNFVRQQMEKYKYLEDEAGPTEFQIGMMIFIILGLLFGGTIYFHKTESGFTSMHRFNNFRGQFRRRYPY